MLLPICAEKGQKRSHLLLSTGNIDPGLGAVEEGPGPEEGVAREAHGVVRGVRLGEEEHRVDLLHRRERHLARSSIRTSSDRRGQTKSR